MADIAMPRLSDSMQEGTIHKWLKADGDVVRRGEELVEIETDKANMTYESDQDGVLDIVAQEGDTLPVGETIARIAGDAAEPAAPALAADAGASAASAESIKGETTVAELTRVQQVLARRMAESKATAPEIVLETEVDMEAAVALRAELESAAGDEPAPSVNDLVVKAAALALVAHPRVNGAYRDGRVELYSRVNVGIAVAAQDALVVPTIFDADGKSLGRIAREARTAAERARAGTITPPELAGGTFTVSNLGMYGVTRFTPILTPSQAAILAVGALAPRAVVRGGRVVQRHVLDLRLVCDNRILYGAEAADFLAAVRERLEQPLKLTL